MSVRGPALRNTDLRSRHAHMRLAVAHATIPPRRTAPTRPGRRRPRWAARTHPAGPPARAGKRTTRKNIHGKRTLSDQPPGDLQKLDRAVSYEKSWGSGRAPEAGGGDGAVDMSGDGPPGGADRGGSRDGLVVRGEGI